MAQGHKGLTYADAGVDIDAGNLLVEKIKPAAKATSRPGVMGGLGGFGALFDLKAAGYADPVLVAATDGVGTKLRIAIDTGHLDTIGIDLVAMCVNDLVCQGAEPLFFLDYFATGKLDVAQATRIITGIAAGCAAAGCALIGGETAEMPGMYHGGDFDLAGFAVGAMERGGELPQFVGEGDVLLGLASSGVHSNGYSLVRKVVELSGLGWDAPSPFGEGSLGQALLAPTRLYVRQALAAVRAGGVHGLAHITGGGAEREPTAGAATGAGLRDRSRGLGGAGGLSLAGHDGQLVGAGAAQDLQLRDRDDRRGRRRSGRGADGAAVPGGRDGLPPGSDRAGRGRDLPGHPDVKRVAILISGGGSNMVALVQAMTGDFPARPVLVFSNNPEAAGLARAQGLGVPVAAVDHRPFGKDRAGFEVAMARTLDLAAPDIICLAGFMRILTPGFVRSHQGRMLNIHPSLLPKYPGLHTHEQALAHGDLEAGCTVHEVTARLDAGPILGQARVPILAGDTAATLARRVLVAEHRLYPQALRFFAAR